MHTNRATPRRRTMIEHWALCDRCNGGGCQDCAYRGEFSVSIPVHLHDMPGYDASR
ncbi:hypothetical protein [Nocardia abscessus]|uniref:hypothetical protein n=1 Tax=Nocardia abscessus TaxID=120957 RepID=UPI002454FBD8|nr:hypothetical protein [Nocardia abscessus]